MGIGQTPPPCFHSRDTTTPPALCHAKSQQQGSGGELGVAGSRDTGAPWRGRVGVIKKAHSQGVLLEQRQDWGGARKGSWGDLCGT